MTLLMSYTRCRSVCFLVDSREVGHILESHIYNNVLDFLTLNCDHFVGYFQPFADNPFLWSLAAHFLEIALEGGQAAPGVIGKFFQREVIHIVLIHEPQNVYFPRIGKIEQRSIDVPIRIEDCV